ncbi:MAG: glycerate kinase [Actinomyces sp.]|nr:MAG: glycerate kinase [Actinomyces sp.]
MRVVCAPDKFRGTVSAAEAAAALARGARAAGAEAVACPLADGGEGTLDVLGGPNRTSVVTGPLGEPVEAGWRLDGSTAWIEMARASGLALVGGAEGNDPLAATTAGTGELIARALDAGARRIVVAVGGSATTDGGLGALRAIPLARLAGVELVVACDVRTRFVEAAETFAPQKGASAAAVSLLRRRLERLACDYRDEFGVDVTDLPGGGAAGGLAGALAAVGARLVDGFEVVVEETGVDAEIEAADLVLTGEGRLDATSFAGKVVGGVVSLAAGAGVPVAAVVGETDPDWRRAPGAPRGLTVVELVERWGPERARTATAGCLAEAASSLVADLSAGS